MSIIFILLVLLIVTRTFGEIAERLGQPALLGELVSGICLGVLVHHYHQTFPILAGLPDNDVFKAITDLGIFFLKDAQPTIYSLADDSPAGNSGLAPGDVITQVNGYQYTQAALWWAAAHPMPVTLNVQRGHRELSFTVHPGTRRHVTSLVWRGSDEQARVIEQWLEPAKFRPDPGQVFKLDFYENFHGIETMI